MSGSMIGWIKSNISPDELSCIVGTCVPGAVN